MIPLLDFTVWWGTVMPIITTHYNKCNNGGMYIVRWKHKEARKTFIEDTIGLRHEGEERIF